jgi:hypothetical protein
MTSGQPFVQLIMKHILLLLTVGGGLFTPNWQPLHAQSGGPFKLEWATIDAGGSTRSGGQFALSGTIGQPDAGTLIGGNFKIEGGFWSGVAALQIPGAPLLKIQRGPTGLAVISWSRSVTGFTLEETTAPGNSTWTNTPYPVVETANDHTVTVPATNGLRIFRLRRTL